MADDLDSATEARLDADFAELTFGDRVKTAALLQVCATLTIWLVFAFICMDVDWVSTANSIYRLIAAGWWVIVGALLVGWVVRR